MIDDGDSGTAVAAGVDRILALTRTWLAGGGHGVPIACVPPLACIARRKSAVLETSGDARAAV